ncbi:peptide-methionine (S)-S-oxide reductase [Segatella copri]|uniref:peptide-methionine (S)-S-oxide reductase n=1 Tax=Segatella copri TaxID=165179 RepID=UPI00222F60AD|nr:peptide-methionine (S)-S-oxide reductase [Segatella copri]
MEFNPQQVSYESLCKLFFEIHDPAQTDGVGPDLEPQYRSCIFYRNESQKQTAEHVTELLRSKSDESIPCSCQRRHSTLARPTTSIIMKKQVLKSMKF